MEREDERPAHDTEVAATDDAGADVPSSEWTAPPRDVPPPRPVGGARTRRRRPQYEPASIVGDADVGVGPDPEGRDPDGRDPDDRDPDGPDADEPAWLRERREEAEFAREFGDWRAGPRRPTRRGGPTGGVVGILLVLVGVAVVLVIVLS